MIKSYNMDVSILVPTFNKKIFLEKCIDSLINQNFSKNRYEIIIVDDGSTDYTGKLIKTFKKNNDKPDIKYIRTNHFGQANARNVGLKIVKGDVVVFLDHDCTVDKNWVKRIFRIHKNNPQLGAIGGFFKNPYKDNIFSDVANNIINEALKNNLTLPGGYSSCKYCLLTKHRFFKSYISGEDADLSCRLIEKGIKIKKLKKLYVCHNHYHTLKTFLQQAFWYGRMDYTVKMNHSKLYGINDFAGYISHSINRFNLIKKVVDKYESIDKKGLALLLTFLYILSYAFAVSLDIMDNKLNSLKIYL